VKLSYPQKGDENRAGIDEELARWLIGSVTGESRAEHTNELIVAREEGNIVN